MQRRGFLNLLAAGALWPIAAKAKRGPHPLIGFLSARSADESRPLVAAFRKGLAEAGIREGQNVAIDFSWADGQYQRLDGQAADFVNRRVALLVTAGGGISARAAAAEEPPIPHVSLII